MTNLIHRTRNSETKPIAPEASTGGAAGVATGADTGPGAVDAPSASEATPVPVSMVTVAQSVAENEDASAARPAPAVCLANVTVSYRQRTVLRGISSSFEEGLVHGIIGPNGAGKSTLIKAILGLLRRSGRIDIRGQDLDSLTARGRARLMSYLPQDIPPVDMTGHDYVTMGRYPWRSRLGGLMAGDVSFVEEALDATGAQSWSPRAVRTTSGGERQLTALSRAIAQQPSILIVDEPSSALDMGHEMSVFGLLRPWIQEQPGRTIIAVLHDLSLAARFCDRLTLLVDGEIAAQGTPDEVLRPELLKNAYGVNVDVRRHKITGALQVTVL